MVKKFCFIFMLFLILLAGCQESLDAQSGKQEENEVVKEEVEEELKDEKDKTETPEGEGTDEPQKSEKEVVLEKADQVIRQIKGKNAEELSKYIHQDKGVVFSPYVHIEPEAVTFKQDDIQHFFHMEEKYTWGMRDGSGQPIELSPSEYYEEFIYDADFNKADEIVYNPEDARGNTIRNVKDVFPNSQVVEYYVKGTEENGNMDWKALNLVFEKDSSEEWKLVAVVHDQWTI